MEVLKIYLDDKEYEFERTNLGIIEYFLKESNIKDDIVLGTGEFNFQGASRLTIVFRSPLTGGLYSSTAGGAGIYLKKAGINIIHLIGKSSEPVFLGIKNKVVRFYPYSGELKGVKDIAMQGYKIMKDFLGERFRTINIGLASHLNFSLVYSTEVPTLLYEDYAGRGGAGKKFREKNLFLIGINGDNKVPFQNPVEAGKILEVTKKYREFGTFGGNYPKLKELIVFENWTHIFKNAKAVLEKILNNMVSIFKKETLEKRKFRTCGDFCSVACKKYYKDKKVDYEPMHGLGPNLGIYDIDKVIKLVSLVDNYGMDAIETGNILSFLLEYYNEMGNYEKALELLNKIAYGEIEVKNIRVLAKKLNSKDIAVYNAYGDEGAITPNFYWSLGTLIPLPLAGRYWTWYQSGIYLEPEELANKIINNAKWESMYDNLGICRFHRKWVKEYLKEKVPNIEERGLEIVKEFYKINNRLGAKPIFWESKRVQELILKIFEKNDVSIGLKEYWERFWKEYRRILGVR